MVLSADVEWNDGRRHSIKPYQLFRKRKPQKHKHLWKLSFNLPLLLRNMTVTRGIRSVTLRAELQSELFGKQGQNRQELLLVPPEDPFQVRSRTFLWHTKSLNHWKQYKFNFLFIKTSKIDLIFLPAFYLIYVAHDITKEFWKNAILKIW